ncbi:MAG: hypothetical protein ACYC1M_03980 [Armatimonadota bacterium]
MASTDPYPVYCVNCRRAIRETDVYCPYCQQDQRPGAPDINVEKMRQQAAQAAKQAQQPDGQATSWKAQQEALAARQSQQPGVNEPMPMDLYRPTGAPVKNKSTALILAVIFGHFTWVYTYRYDSWKFWLGLVLSVLTCGVASIVFWLWAVIEAVGRPDSFYAEYIS